MTRKEKNDLRNILGEVITLIDNYVDVVDGEDGGYPLPNDAMRAVIKLEEFLLRLE